MKGKPYVKQFKLVVMSAIAVIAVTTSGLAASDTVVSLKSHHGRHLVAESNHSVKADREAIGNWEKWAVVREQAKRACPVNTSFFVRDSCVETPDNEDCCVCPEGTKYTSVSAGYRQCKQ